MRESDECWLKMKDEDGWNELRWHIAYSPNGFMVRGPASVGWSKGYRLGGTT